MEEKALTMIEQHKEEEFILMLEDTLEQFNRMELVNIRRFIKANYKKFKAMFPVINDGTDRYVSEYTKYINDDKGISCRIYNCEEIDKFSKVDLEITFKFFDRHSTSTFLLVKGSGELKGCNMEDADQFMKMVDSICKPTRIKFFQRNNMEE